MSEPTENSHALIQQLLDSNRVEDLKGFLRRRSCLNCTNVFLMYMFHIIQTAGILTTTLAAGYDMKEVIWVGASLNALASLIQIFEKLNDALSKQYAKDIQLIRENNYVDEAPVDLNHENNSNKS